MNTQKFEKDKQISDDVQNEIETGKSEREDEEVEKKENEDIKKDFREKIGEEFGEIVQNIERDTQGNVYLYLQYQKEYLTNYGIMTGDGARFNDVNFSGSQNKKKQGEGIPIVEDSEKLEEWISENYNTMKVPYLIACSVFYFMPYMWVTEVAENLAFLLHGKNDVQPNIFPQQNLREFGVETYKDTLNSNIGKTQVDYVRFLREEYAENILNCIWKFPSIRNQLTVWLTDCMLSKRSTMSYRASMVFAQLAKQDFHFFAHTITKHLFKQKNILADMGLAQTVIRLDADEKYQKNIDNMIKQWSKMAQRHYHLVVLLICTGKKGKLDYIRFAVENYLDRILQEFKNYEDCDHMIQSIRDFFLVGMRDYMFYRILIERLHDYTLEREKKDYICLIFLIMFLVDTDYSSFEEDYKKEAVFVKLAYSPNQVRSKLCALWHMSWRISGFRKQFYSELGRYFARFPENERKSKIVQFVESVFAAYCDEDYRTDIVKRINVQSRRTDDYE